MLSRAARSSRSRSMPGVKSTFTRRTGLTTVNLLVKYREMSSPRDAISAISSAVHVPLDVFGIALFFLAGRFPGRHKVVKLAPGVMPDLEDHGTEAAAAPTYCTKLFRVIALLVDEIHLIKYVLRLFQADPVLSLDVPTLLSLELEPHRPI